CGPDTSARYTSPRFQLRRCTMFLTHWRSRQVPCPPRGRRHAHNGSFRPVCEALEGRLAPATFTVITDQPTGPGSLGQAILDANATPNVGAVRDTITFNIPGAGVHTIAPQLAALPTITDPVVIDGYTQPGASPNTLAGGDNAVLLIELTGVNLQ